MRFIRYRHDWIYRNSGTQPVPSRGSHDRSKRMLGGTDTVIDPDTAAAIPGFNGRKGCLQAACSDVEVPRHTSEAPFECYVELVAGAASDNLTARPYGHVIQIVTARRRPWHSEASAALFGRATDPNAVAEKTWSCTVRADESAAADFFALEHELRAKMNLFLRN